MMQDIYYPVQKFESDSKEKKRAVCDLIKRIVRAGIKEDKYMDLLEYLMLFKSQKKIKLKGETVG
jgi:hypothetical protein